jgi:hypothetical protein
MVFFALIHEGSTEKKTAEFGSPEPRRCCWQNESITAATTTTAAAAIAAAEFTATAAAASRALFAGAGHIDRQGAATHILAVQTGDGGLGLFVGTHGDEPKTA